MAPLPRRSVFPRRRVRRSGFTLVELLTVIAIVGVLTAILIPVISKMRSSARSSECLSNLRQVFVGYMTYVADNRGNLPRAHYRDDNGNNQDWMTIYSEGLMADLRSHVGCPVQRANKMDRWLADSWYASRATTIRTYSLNNGLSKRSVGGSVREYPLASFESPSRTLLVADGNNSDSGGNALYYNSVLDPGSNRRPEFVHNGRANVVYLDGHAGSLREDEVPRNAETTPGTRAHLFWYGVTTP